MPDALAGSLHMKVDWDRFVEVIGEAKNIVLTSHIRPDCDALGSCLGMAGILEALGKQIGVRDLLSEDRLATDHEGADGEDRAELAHGPGR